MLRKLFLLALLAGTHSVHAGQLAGSGDRLQMLRKIQGQWQSSCHRASSGAGSQQISLRFSFTHLKQHRTRYADQHCQRRVAEQEQNFAFVLGDTVIAAGGERAYAIDLRGEGSDASFLSLHPSNLIQYRGGQVRLGLMGAQESHQRLTQLDHQSTFTRP